MNKLTSIAPALLALALMPAPGLAADGAAAAPVAGALERPAATLSRPDQAVLLGVARAGKRVVAVGERGVVLLSDDDGASWRQAAVPVSVTLTAVRFVDASRGFAVGHGGVVLASADAGRSWSKRLDGRRAAQIALAAAKAGGDARAVQDAERLRADGADKPLFDLHFFDAAHGIVVGAYNLAFATDDGGQTWRSLMDGGANPRALHLYALRARGDTLLVAGEQGLALRSDDRGRSFRRLDVPYKGSFFTAEMLGPQDWVLAGLRGNVWRSRDGGASWNRWELATPASVTASALLPAGAGQAGLLMVNQAGQVLRRDGEQLRVLPGAPMAPLNALLPLADGGLLALGMAGPVRTAGGAK